MVAYQSLRWSSESERAALAEVLDTHYRNANIRFAISEDMINRLLPTSSVIRQRVNDTILGAQVQGRSETRNLLRVILIPDRLRWRLGLEARGRIASNTTARSGPALFFNDGLAKYRAEKVLVVDQTGVSVGKTEVHAESSSDLTGLETSLDPLPFIGVLARAVAVQQHVSKQDEAQSEAQYKMAGTIRQRMDHEVEGRLVEAEQHFQQKLLVPMQRLDLEPMIMDLATTGQRLIARYRLAGHQQLAAHTARPQAPGDSLFSIQIHQSAINNLIHNLRLDDRHTDLISLAKEVQEIFHADRLISTDDLPEDVHLHFAKHDAVRVDFQEGRIALTLKLRELSSGSRHWHNFVVRGYYLPTSAQIDAHLARDGYIELIGKRLNFRDQIALRGIFCKVLDKNQTISLVDDQLVKNPKMSDLMITQCSVENGWIGLAIGPKRRGLTQAISTARAPDEEQAR
jgi:hypothetical protein